MLILRAYVNYDEIDTILVQNMGEVSDGIYEYVIRKPKIEKRIFHERDKGWVPLAKKVLEVLEKEKC
jgi:hypothetical protein